MPTCAARSARAPHPPSRRDWDRHACVSRESCCIPVLSCLCLHVEPLLWTLRTLWNVIRIPMLYKKRTLIRRIHVCLLRHRETCNRHTLLQALRACAFHFSRAPTTTPSAAGSRVASQSSLACVACGAAAVDFADSVECYKNPYAI